MAYRFQFRGDTEVKWKDVVLADREIGLLLDNNGRATNLYKIGDGVSKYQDLPYFGFNGAISDKLTVEEGEKIEQTVLNKKSVIDEFARIGTLVSELGEDLNTAQTDIDNIESCLGNQGDNDDVYTEIDKIKAIIGTKEGNDVYTELTDIKANANSLSVEINKINGAIGERHQTVVIDSLGWEGMLSNPDNVWKDVLYFVYE